VWTVDDLNGSGRFDTHSQFPNAVAVGCKVWVGGGGGGRKTIEVSRC